mgnify:CR=1 FL=1|tara:strand:- start:7229 stop:7864 length:636 start_codon:yes stop_codon:yes gene_type:complete
MEKLLFNKNFTCVAVSKTKPVDDIEKIYNLGHKEFGENKVQELLDKYDKLPKDIKWHMIGHLQTNKIKKVIPIISLIHSVDSLKLLKKINNEAIKINKVISCLLQINISNENNKYGFTRDQIREIFNNEVLKDFKFIRIKGLMGMASFTENENQIRIEFKNLKKIFDELKIKYPELKIISMGMSGDYKIAIEEGSNMIRIGSKIFGKRNYQ